MRRRRPTYVPNITYGGWEGKEHSGWWRTIMIREDRQYMAVAINSALIEIELNDLISETRNEK